MTIIRSGELREILSIQAFTSEPDGAGGQIKSWADVHSNVRAKIEPLNGGEAFRRGVLNSTQLYRVIIRYRNDVSPRHRLLWLGNALNIRTCADPDNRREALLMTVESGAGEP